jgi:hypothetical protein
MSTLPGSTQETSALNDGESTNPSTNTHIQDIIDTRLSRRGVLKGGIAASTTALFSSIGLSACGGSSNNKDDAPDAQLRRRRQEQERRGHRARGLPGQHPACPRRPPALTATSLGTTAAKAPSPTTVALAMATTACTTSACPKTAPTRLPLRPRAAVRQPRIRRRPQALHPLATAGAARVASEVEKEIYAHGVSVCEVKRGLRLRHEPGARLHLQPPCHLRHRDGLQRPGPWQRPAARPSTRRTAPPPAAPTTTAATATPPGAPT